MLFLVFLIKPFSSPRKIVYSTEGKYLKYIYEGRDVKQVAKEAGDHLYTLSKRKRPQDGNRMSYNDKKYHIPEYKNVHNELLLVFILVRVHEYRRGIVKEQYKHSKPINAKKRRGPIINPLEPGIVMIDQT